MSSKDSKQRPQVPQQRQPSKPNFWERLTRRPRKGSATTPAAGTSKPAPDAANAATHSSDHVGHHGLWKKPDGSLLLVPKAKAGMHELGGCTMLSAPTDPAKRGTRKALLIGCNYIGHGEWELEGCVHDVYCMAHLLHNRFGFRTEDMVILADEERSAAMAGEHKHLPAAAATPTRDNVLMAIQWLTHDVEAGDSLFFHFSGHGEQFEDPMSREMDGLSEAILCSGMVRIQDVELHECLIQRIPKGAFLFAFMDACHCAGALNMPFVVDRTVSRKRTTSRSEQWFWTLAAGCSRDLSGLTWRGGQIVQFSACDEDQIAHETTKSKRIHSGCPGIGTFLFFTAVSNLKDQGKPLTYKAIIESMWEGVPSTSNYVDYTKDWFGRQFNIESLQSQEPQLSSMEQFNVEEELKL